MVYWMQNKIFTLVRAIRQRSDIKLVEAFDLMPVTLALSMSMLHGMSWNNPISCQGRVREVFSTRFIICGKNF